ncbi:hypothetical protein BJV78DRAFT_561353 [Lactifluus subvellereus]|nr:hypothetical protein BJV78DRAFT_561353 [Lactifluus subvellereus]
MLPAPFSSSGEPEPTRKYVILTRGGARTRCNALPVRDVTNLPSGPLPPAKPLTSSSLPVRKPPPLVTILTNPARRHPPSVQEVQTTQPSALTPKRAPASILGAPAPARARGSSVAAAAEVDARNGRQQAASKPAAKPADLAKGEYKWRQLLPRIVIREPFWWDSWTDVHHPGMSYGEMLDVPAVNRCGKMYEDDLARYYPTEYMAEQTVKRLRSMVRSGRRLAAAHRRERARQDKKAGIASSTDTQERPLATRAPPPRSRFSS